jgi:hypothetical protein
MKCLINNVQLFVGFLILTMNYLLSEIADRGGDGKWGDWFDFLWDRTRGIRKVRFYCTHIYIYI